MHGIFAGIQIFAVVLIINGVTAVSGCSYEELMQCSGSLSGLSELTINITKDELEKRCRTMQSQKQCINEYAARCMNPTEQDNLNSMYEGVYVVMNSICQPGKQQDEYLQSSCNERVTPEFELCSGRYARALTGLHNAPSADSSSLKDFCCSFQEFVDCSVQTVDRNCGQKTAAFIESIHKMMSINIFKGVCNQYSNDECPSRNTGVKLGSSWLILGVTLPSVLRAL